MTTARSEADRGSAQLVGSDLGLTPGGLTKTGLVPTTDQPQKAKDFTSDQEVRWCPGCGDYVILNTIRNFLPERPYLQPCRYKDAKNILIALRQWNSDGKLNPTQLLVFRDVRPPEELYDVHQDPYEINNLAANPDYATKLAVMRGQLDDWMKATDDKGQQAEPESMYNSDMAVYLTTLRRKGDPVDLKRLKDNIALMKKWATEGK